MLATNGQDGTTNGREGTTNGHEWTRMGRMKPRKTRKARKIQGGGSRTTNEHEKHEKYKGEDRTTNGHERTRIGIISCNNFMVFQMIIESDLLRLQGETRGYALRKTTQPRPHRVRVRGSRSSLAMA